MDSAQFDLANEVARGLPYCGSTAIDVYSDGRWQAAPGPDGGFRFKWTVDGYRSIDYPDYE